MALFFFSFYVFLQYCLKDTLWTELFGAQTDLFGYLYLKGSLSIDSKKWYDAAVLSRGNFCQKFTHFQA